MTTAPSTLELPRELEAALLGGHPWVYATHVPASFAAPSGTWLRVRAGRFVGYGLWDAESKLALRIFSAARPPDAEWLAARVRTSWGARASLRSRGGTSAYRWLSGEGDGVPGVVVDLYGRFAVVVLDTPACEVLLPWLVEALRAEAPLSGIVRRHRDRTEARLELLWGRLPPRELIVEENALRFRVDLFAGQKTGLFLDQRDNRSFVEGVAAGRSVLNLFAYTGAFSLYALRGGATVTTSVDLAPEGARLTLDCFALNGFDPDGQRVVTADCFSFLEGAAASGERFDLVICDPPSLARSKAQRQAALGAYERLNRLALGAVAPGGLLATASCTAQVGSADFDAMLVAAARRAGKRLRRIHEAGHALDHPVTLGHPEGRYLHFSVLRVEERS